ncbi:hypothetical protein NQ317_018415 [Molorchus minor]|uniref:Retrovirus-related Pol polyprotein from transposon TNT 1-94-like beta-barrel domain-containing protein n=1 Tax=Molorchus minor TaxID=1323400 RepID=A0ABQ9JRZ6_9CUCU|nr:hypothetical protein NQ317_018415 [Molorchus minor]
MTENKLKSYILGKVQRTPDNVDEWDEKDAQTQAFLMRGLELKQLKYLSDCTTAAQMWSRLKTVHAEKSDQSVHLDRFINCKMEDDENMTDYIAKVTSLTQRLKDMDMEQTAWYAVPKSEQNIEKLTDHLVNEEALLNARATATLYLRARLAHLLTVDNVERNNIKTEDAWFADSGATEHMSFRREWFKNFTPYSEKIYSVRVGDGTLIDARGRGDIDVAIVSNGKQLHIPLFYHNKSVILSEKQLDNGRIHYTK